MTALRHLSVLTLAAAKRLAAAAESEAVGRGWTVGIAIVDPAGGLICFLLLDGTQPASEEIAIAKARTAARLKRPTRVLEDGIAGGRTALLSVPGMLSLEGGLPFLHQGQVVGAIGVSGMTSPEDAIVAQAALRAFAEESSR
jgi:uncharacterized protein GlcG (DUF336 family)